MKTNILDKALPAERLQSTAYSVQKSNLEQASKVMAAAFGNDPSIRYLLGGES